MSANDARVGVTSKCHCRSTFRVTLCYVIRVHLQLRHLDSSQARLQHSLTMAKFDGAHEKRGVS
jgi:hypothetical protein